MLPIGIEPNPRATAPLRFLTVTRTFRIVPLANFIGFTIGTLNFDRGRTRAGVGFRGSARMPELGTELGSFVVDPRETHAVHAPIADPCR